ncbi:MAG: hypothetical protein CVV27_03335 [Candidatus Melainabacteria bacterium HGW-Melainabacteria-1]|nr:MAG: hypothetical protein CVV27_03335 [Candidatus Melainabacteria bacterium HGW-Melainabacteria-1]
MLIRTSLKAALTASVILLSACTSQLPLQQAPRPAQVQTANTLRSTNGALLLIEDMAHASTPQEFDRIEAAFKAEIAKSTRPSLNKIIANAVEAIDHHPIPGQDFLSHPVARLIGASLERYLNIRSKTLIARAFLLFEMGDSDPAMLEAKVQKFQRSLNNLPKMDARDLLGLIGDGFFANEIEPGSPLEARLVKMLQDRLAARI